MLNNPEKNGKEYHISEGFFYLLEQYEKIFNQCKKFLEVQRFPTNCS